MQLTIRLTSSEVQTLTRCLRYGKAAVSEKEEHDGTAERIRRDCDAIQRKLEE